MSDYIALKPSRQTVMEPKSWAIWDLKQYALLFDKIGIKSLHAIKMLASNIPEFQSKLVELAWLEDQNIIFTPEIDYDLINQNKKLKGLFASSKKNDFRIIEQIKKGRSWENESDELMRNLWWEGETIELRILSIQLESIANNTVVPLIPYSDYLYKNLPHIRNDVVQIVIKHLPIPDNTTPWEAIIDYRSDPDSRHSLLSLRRWMRKISSTSTSATEIEEELDYLLSEFQRHMKVHKIKANTETLETVIKAPLEIIEDVVKFKFSKIPEPLFAIKKRQIMLMEAELNAPGNELAYILKSKQLFASD